MTINMCFFPNLFFHWIVPQFLDLRHYKSSLRRAMLRFWIPSLRFVLIQVTKDLPFSWEKKNVFHTALDVKGCKLRVIKVIVQTLPEILESTWLPTVDWCVTTTMEPHYSENTGGFLVCFWKIKNVLFSSFQPGFEKHRRVQQRDFFPKQQLYRCEHFLLQKRVEIITWFTTTSDKLVKTLL